MDYEGRENRKRQADSFNPDLLPMPVVVLLAFTVGVLLLIPCFWQPYIPAGDLSTHVYNAWLTGEVQSGAVDGFTIASQWINTLGDRMLAFLLPRLGPDLAEQVVAAIAIETFFWGMFTLISAANPRRPWSFMPILAVISYGWIFHMGFLNFFLSAGICLFVLALLWTPKPWRLGLAAVLLILALAAHPMPPLWAVSIAAYLLLFQKTPEAFRLFLPVAVTALMILGGYVLWTQLPASYVWDYLISLDIPAFITGAHQVLLFDEKYLIPAGGFFFLWVWMLIDRVDRGGMLQDPAAHIWMLHLPALFVLPASIQFPGYEHSATFIPHRIAMWTAVMFLVMAAQASRRTGVTRMTGIIAAAFFSFLFVDYQAFNRVEQQLEVLFQDLTIQDRAVATVIDQGVRINALGHVADRACIGHCMSYANYEPVTGQFRIQKDPGNTWVAPDMQTMQQVEQGAYVVLPEAAPIYAACACPDQPTLFCLREFTAGQRVCSSSRQISFRLWDEDRLEVQQGAASTPSPSSAASPASASSPGQ